MRARSVVRFEILIICLTGFVLAIPCIGNGEGTKKGSRAGGGEVSSQEYSFSLTKVPENSTRYSLVISDMDESTISGVFSIDQLQVLRAIMTEAERFALTGEAAGTKDSITTRFMDKHDNAFIVDVEKAANQSKLFLTLKTEIGRMTVEAGKVVRSNRREEGFFFDLLSRLESVLPKPGK